ncbi:hypothetical protein [Mangrovibacterium sp.]|uniref:hypothetical protein n=1 Tax=Mangrovibacterium sp. TaxID=1961364 RepID=UPI003563A1CD
MKAKLIGILFVIVATLSVSAQNYSVRAVGYDISDNLDLEAVSYLFGESRDLQDFEYRLNDPQMQISNLDLNQDGWVDYLRVVEVYEYGIHLVTIQAVLDQDIYQDVATIDAGQIKGGNYYVQVVGDPYLYGPNYIIEPTYVRVPLIFSWFFRPNYVVWHSPYYWGYYPSRYKHYRCLPTFNYHRNLHVHIDYHVNTYHYSTVRRNTLAVELHRKVYRNDYAQRHPSKSFSSRNTGYSNKYELSRSRSVSESRGDRRPTGQATYNSGSRSGSSRSVSSRSDAYRGTSETKSARISTTQPNSSQRKGSDVNYNRSSGQSQVKSGTKSVGRSPASANTSRSVYQPGSTSKSATGSGSKQQFEVRSSRSSSTNNSTYRSTQQPKVESSSSRSAKSNSVSRSANSSGRSVAKQSSISRKAESSSTTKSGTVSTKKSERSKRR